MSQTVLLGDIADIQTGPFGSQLHQKDYVKTGTPIVTVEHLGSDRMTTQNLPRVSDKDSLRLKKYHLEEGDTVFSRVGSVDRASYVHAEENGWLFSGRCLRVRPHKNSVNPRFLSFLLRSPGFTGYIKSIAVGATMPSINTKILSSVSISLPSRHSQDQIAILLDGIERKIELNQRMNKTLEQIGQFEFEELLRQSNTSVNLEKIVNFNPRESLPKGTDAACLEMKNLSEVGLSVSGSERKAYNGGTKFRNGDTLLARITPCLENGKTGYVDFLHDDEVAFGSTEYIVMRPDDARLREFIYHLARSKGFRAKAIQSMVGTSGRQRVQTDSLRTYKIPVLAQEQIEEFHQNARARFEAIRCNSQQIHALSALRDGLLPRLISGSMEI